MQNRCAPALSSSRRLGVAEAEVRRGHRLVEEVVLHHGPGDEVHAARAAQVPVAAVEAEGRVARLAPLDLGGAALRPWANFGPLGPLGLWDSVRAWSGVVRGDCVLDVKLQCQERKWG